MWDGIPIAQLTPGVLLGIAVLLVFIGRLVPRNIYQDKVKECDKWQKAFEIEREGRITAAAQTKELLELARANNDIVEAAFGRSSHSRQSGGTDVVPTSTQK